MIIKDHRVVIFVRAFVILSLCIVLAACMYTNVYAANSASVDGSNVGTSDSTVAVNSGLAGVEGTSTGTDNSLYKAKRIGYIYTGDSRIRRLNLTINMKKMSDTWVVCKSGMGYGWFVNYGLPQIKNIMKTHSSIDEWVIISGWGVNDLWNANTYTNRYTSLLNKDWKGCHLYLMSVNPVNGSKVYKYGGIASFNTKIKAYIESYNKKNNVISAKTEVEAADDEDKSVTENSEPGSDQTDTEKSVNNITYIDSYSVMRKQGFSTIDGLHYSESTNRLIYKTVRSKLDEDYSRINYDTFYLNYNCERNLKILDDNYCKVKWKSSNNKIVKILETSGANNEKVLIKARRPGTAVVTAKTKNKTYQCTVNVLDEKNLIAYFSYSGEAECVAEYIQTRVGGDLFEIEPEKLYPQTTKKLDKRIKRELTNNERPALYSPLSDISIYSSIYLGYPLWLENMPRLLCTFLESYDLTGKDVYPFTVYPVAETKDETNKFGNSLAELKTLAPASAIQDGFAVDADHADTSKTRKAIRKWTK